MEAWGSPAPRFRKEISVLGGWAELARPDSRGQTGAWEAGRTWGSKVEEGTGAPAPLPPPATVFPSCAITTYLLAPTAQSMFQIPEFEQSEQEDSSPAERGLGPSPTGDQPPGLNKHWSTIPGSLGEAGHQQGQPASSSHHGGRHPPHTTTCLPLCSQPSSSLHLSFIHTRWVALSKSPTSLDLSFPLL